MTDNNQNRRLINVNAVVDDIYDQQNKTHCAKKIF